jgi:hypothetical protein
MSASRLHPGSRRASSWKRACVPTFARILARIDGSRRAIVGMPSAALLNKENSGRQRRLIGRNFSTEAPEFEVTTIRFECYAKTMTELVKKSK